MNRCSRSLAAIGAAVALTALAAPSASAAVGPEDAAGCTTTYVGTVGGPYILPNPPTVSYTPPASVTVDADDAVSFTLAVATRVANATVTYVNCVV